MNGFERRKEQKQAAIREAALRLYKQHGLRQVGIAAIAREAQVSQVTIYNYFGSKERLTLDVLDRYLAAYLDEFAAFCLSEQPYREKLEQLLLRSSALDELHVEFMELLLSEDPAIATIVGSYEARLIPLFVSLIEEGKQFGYINRELSTETLLLFINLFSSQALAKVKAAGDDASKRQMYKELFTLFFHGVSDPHARLD